MLQLLTNILDSSAPDAEHQFPSCDVEIYLVEGLQNENLSARAREQRDAILIDVKHLKQRYHCEFISGGVSADRFLARDTSNDSQTWSSTLPVPSEAPNGNENIQKRTRELGVILKQGYLEKKSKDPKIFGSEWQKRWCVLDQMSFYYYANEKSKQPKGMFAVENYHAQMAFNLRKDTRRDCCFELSCPGKRTYEFTASTPGEAKDWVDQILFLLKDMRSHFIPYEEEEEEDKETYDDIDSFDSPDMMLHQNATLQLGDAEVKGQNDEGIYEVLPEDDLDFSSPDNKEDVGNKERPEDVLRSYTNYYQGLWDCIGAQPDELSFQRGDVIYIISKEYSIYGWWVGELNSMVGIVPKEYLMPAFDMEES